MKLSFSANGLENLLADINKAGNDIDNAIEQALNESGDLLLEAQQEAMRKHQRTGSAYQTLKKSDIIKTGDKQEILVGAIDIGNKKGLHIIYFEYGSPTTPAVRWKRGSIEKNASKIRAKQKKILKKWGVPTE